MDSEPILARSPAAEISQSAVEDPLMKILQCLDDMQGQISSWKAATTTSTSQPVSSI